MVRRTPKQNQAAKKSSCFPAIESYFVYMSANAAKFLCLHLAYSSSCRDQRVYIHGQLGTEC